MQPLDIVLVSLLALVVGMSCLVIHWMQQDSTDDGDITADDIGEDI